MDIKPLADRIIVRRMPPEATQGLIIIPSVAQEKPLTGKVIAVGPGKRLENGTLVPVDVNKGDIVLFGKYSGNAIKEQGDEDLLIIKEEEVLGIVLDPKST